MRVLKLSDVVKRIGLSKVTVWRLEREGRFPKRLQLADRVVGWPEQEIDEWVASRPRGISQRGAAMTKCTYLQSDLTHSAAFARFNGTAIRVLIFIMERKQLRKNAAGGWDVTNNGEIIFPYSEARESFGIGARQFTRAIDLLVEVGFVDIAHHGGLHDGDFTKYAVSGRWQKYRMPGFVEHQRQKGSKIGFRGRKNKTKIVALRRQKTASSTVKNVCGAGAVENSKPTDKNDRVCTDKNVCVL